MDDLYRIISLESLISLCLNKEERFVNPIDCWEDTHEGYLLQKLDSRKGLIEIIQFLNKEFKGDSDLIINNLSKLQRARYLCYGQSWSHLKDSDALWHVYSYGKHAIQIRSSKEQIKKLVKANDDIDTSLRMRDVIYDLDNNIIHPVYNRSRADEAYFHKRCAFEYEHEFRVIVQLKSIFNDYISFTKEMINKRYKQCKKEGLPLEEAMIDAVEGLIGTSFNGMYDYSSLKQLMLNIPSISEYILGIRVHPQAEQWYVNIVRDICEQYDINFEGQSDLYKGIS